MTEITIADLKKMVKDSSYLVMVEGSDVLRQLGHQSLRDQERAYDIEAEYGYSPEELFSSAFYSTRIESFYSFYKKEVLSQEMEPDAAILAIAKMEREGVLKMIIARSIYGMFQKAGCKNVLDLHGNIENNKCPQCGKIYPKKYLKEAKRVPLCETCMKTIRPGVCLYGEMIDNSVLTKAANEISKADVLLVVGEHLTPELREQSLSYYSGDKLVLISRDPKHTDEEADYAIYGNLSEILPKIAE